MATKRTPSNPATRGTVNKKALNHAEKTGQWVNPDLLRYPKPRKDLPKGPLVEREAFEANLVESQLTNDIIQSIENGCPVNHAFAAAGVPIANWGRWLKRAREGSPQHVEFFAKVAKAKSKAVQRWSGLIEMAARGAVIKVPILDALGKPTGRHKEQVIDTQAVKFLLERRDPQNWGRVDKHELTGARGGPIATASQFVPFRFDPSFTGWTTEELDVYSKTGLIPERYRGGQTSEIAANPNDDLAAYLEGL